MCLCNVYKNGNNKKRNLSTLILNFVPHILRLCFNSCLYWSKQKSSKRQKCHVYLCAFYSLPVCLGLRLKFQNIQPCHKFYIIRMNTTEYFFSNLQFIAEDGSYITNLTNCIFIDLSYLVLDRNHCTVKEVKKVNKVV